MTDIAKRGSLILSFKILFGYFRYIHLIKYGIGMQLDCKVVLTQYLHNTLFYACQVLK